MTAGWGLGAGVAGALCGAEATTLGPTGTGAPTATTAAGKALLLGAGAIGLGGWNRGRGAADLSGGAMTPTSDGAALGAAAGRSLTGPGGTGATEAATCLAGAGAGAAAGVGADSGPNLGRGATDFGLSFSFPPLVDWGVSTFAATAGVGLGMARPLRSMAVRPVPPSPDGRLVAADFGISS